MKGFLKTTPFSLLSLCVLQTVSVHVNKYILSVLGFTYPTVFQGWQTFVTVILIRILMMNNLSPISWKSFRSYLPLFVSFVGSIVAGSKALSALPIPIILAVSNVLPALNCLLTTSDVKKISPISASILCITSVVCVFFSDPNLSDMSMSTMWLLLHLLFIGLQLIIDGEDSALFSPLDKLFYCNLFSVIVLAPSSFYLEEAFEALHFRERRQLSFLLGCVLSGVFGTLWSVLSIHLTPGSVNVHTLSKAVACLLSPLILPCSLNLSSWLLIVTILITSCFIPQGIPVFTEVDNNRLKQMEPV